MKFLFAAVALLLATAPLYAAPFDKGDPKIGKTLVDKSCVSCHASMVGGDGSKIYTRADSQGQKRTATRGARSRM